LTFSFFSDIFADMAPIAPAPRRCFISLHFTSSPPPFSSITFSLYIISIAHFHYYILLILRHYFHYAIASHIVSRFHAEDAAGVAIIFAITYYAAAAGW
jgi:hypothetical protein